MSIKLDPKSRRVVARIKRLDKALPIHLENALYNIGRKLRNTASKNILKRGRTGRVYRHKGRRHVASISGESWANKSGAARRALGWRVSGPKKLVFFNNVVSKGKKKVNYVAILEDPKRLNRRAMWISIKQNNRNIVRLLERAIKKSLEGR